MTLIIGKKDRLTKKKAAVDKTVPSELSLTPTSLKLEHSSARMGNS
jgi:hypothetical protein